jgi:NADP-dependent 3-hydroxy acid dehydrogenase YdfG
VGPLAEKNVALVTGASGGIGGALARALSARGATVCAVGRRREVLEEAARDAGAGRIVPRPADLTRDDEIEALTTELRQDFGRLDVLVHSAGTMFVGKPSEAPVGELDAQYSSNVRAPYLLTQSLLPLLRESGGQVVFLNTSAVLRTRAEVAQYAATYHALKAIADGFRDEVNSDGVRVLSVFPGRTATSRQEALHELEGKPYAPERLIQPEDVAALVVGALELPRTAEVTDLHLRPFLKPG